MAYGLSRELIPHILKRSGAVFLAGMLILLPVAALAKSAGDLIIRLRAIGVVPDEGGPGDAGTAVVVGDTNLDTDINVNKGVIIVKDADVDPWIFGIGVGYRF